MFCLGFVLSVIEFYWFLRLKANQELIKYACDTKGKSTSVNLKSQYGSSLEPIELRKSQILTPMWMSFSSIQSQYSYTQTTTKFSLCNQPYEFRLFFFNVNVSVKKELTFFFYFNFGICPTNFVPWPMISSE